MIAKENLFVRLFHLNYTTDNHEILRSFRQGYRKGHGKSRPKILLLLALMSMHIETRIQRQKLFFYFGTNKYVKFIDSKGITTVEGILWYDVQRYLAS